MISNKTLAVLFLLAAITSPALAVDPCPASAGCIVINEIMYDPPGNPDIEYVELYNNCGVAVDLTNWYLLDDGDIHDKAYLAGTLQPGEYLVVANVLAWFQTKYPGVTNLNPNPFDDDTIPSDPEVGFVLGDGGDQARVFNNAGILQDCVAYNDTFPWRCEPDGSGPSLELYNPAFDNTLPGAWWYSTNGPPEGTPGAQNTVFTPDQPPVISTLSRDIPLPTSSDTVTVTSFVTDQIGLSMVELMVDTGSGFAARLMFDDGLHGDGPAGNSTYGAFIDPLPAQTVVRYYVRATDSAAQESAFPYCLAQDHNAYTVDHTLPELVINEIVASNQTGLIDPDDPIPGTREDWIELKNAGPVAVDLNGMFMANSLVQSLEWALPEVTLEPGDYLVIWADDDADQGELHTNFKLNSSEGSEVALYETIDHGNVMIHGYRFGKQNTDVAYGYFPEDSDAPEYLTTPTPGASNETSTLYSSVVINEFLTTSALGGIDDWVELYNRGTLLVDLNGYHITDERDQPTKFTMPPGVFISPGARISLDETILGFSWSSTGVEVIQVTDNAGGAVDFYDYGPQSNDVSEGRFPDGTANWHFFEDDTHSRGFPNECDDLVLDAVNNLKFVSPIAFTWDPVSGAQDYDTVAVDVGTLRGSAGDYSSALIECTRNNAGGTLTWDDTTPGAGNVIGYLVRATSFSCDFGTYDTTSPSQQGPRDAGIAGAAEACP
jgi:hypothetical protein